MKSIKEIMPFEAALTYTNMKKEDIVILEDNMDYKFSSKNQIDLEKEGVILNNPIKPYIEVTRISLMDESIKVITSTYCGYKSSNVLGGYIPTNVIRKTKVFSIDHINSNLMDIEENIKNNNKTIYEDQYTVQIPDGFVYSQGVSNLDLNKNNIR